ncbi:MAG: hypothetical protein KGL62_04470, partial [Bradyrhizobium sp.]|uniref:hypothetical protein n=1 Tax=Bradyrhizobium sp. TaxID=376 RepID=UPI0023A6759E
VLTRFLYANRYPPTDQVRGHASLENALTIPLRALALTTRVLLLLARLRATTLLLTGLLARVLILLARLVLVGHLQLSFVEDARTTPWIGRWFRHKPGSTLIIA